MAAAAATESGCGCCRCSSAITFSASSVKKVSASLIGTAVPARDRISCLARSDGSSRVAQYVVKRRLLQRSNAGAQCGVPLCRPTADNEPKLIQNSVEKPIYAAIIGRKLFGSVLDPCVEVVAVNLDNNTPLMDKWQCAFDGVRGAEYGRS